MKDEILYHLAEAECMLFYAKNKNPHDEKLLIAWQSAKKALDDYSKAIGKQ